MEKNYTGNKRRKSTSRNRALIFAYGVLILGLLFSSQKSYATHAAGADITYRWLSTSGNNSNYEVTATFYRDCRGIAADPTITVNISSVSCHNTSSATLNQIAGTGQEITFPCSTATTICTNPASTNAGFQKYVYRGTVTLSKCADWVLSYSVLARNCAITTMQQGNPCGGTVHIYVEATLNNLNFANNNSPTFSTVPVTFICLGQNFTYNNGGGDVDGDSLYYELINARDNATTSIPYISPFSGTNPLTSTPPVAINHSNGDITMNAQVVQVGVVAVRIKEFRGGVLIGSVVRDMQFIVQNCGANNLPTVTGINGTTKNVLTVCAGSTASFTLNTNDVDAGQTVTLTWDSGIPGATFTVSGGVHPTGTFTWNTTLADARANPYQFTVTVRDNNCPTNGVQSRSFQIFVPLITVALTPSLHNGNNVSCHGGTNGTILATPSGGTSPYTYSWNTAPVQTTQTATGLGAGSYTVLVTDSNGCHNTATASITLTQPPTLTASVTSQVNVNCFGAVTGSATAQGAGGTPGYTYSWNTIPVQNSQTATGLGNGTYTCTITDINGCTTTTTATITQPSSPLNASIDTVATQNVSCNGNSNGSITLTVTGGTPGYTYVWVPTGDTTKDISGLSPGTYSVTVTDSKGCTDTTSRAITQPGVLVPLLVVDSIGDVNIACHGGSTGSATVSASGGTLPYSFFWDPPFGDTSQTITGLSAGPVAVTVTDANGCTGTASSLLTEPDSLASNIFVQVYPGGFNITCNGLSNGEIDITPNGGTAPYTYLWSTTDTTQNLTNIPAGHYSVTVTDANGCTTSQDTTLIQPDTLSPVITSPVNANGYNIGCHGEATGSVDASPPLTSGGTQPYTYAWSNGDSTSSISGLTAGTYFLTVTDLNGCFDTASITLIQPDTIVPLITSLTFAGGVNISCSGSSNGSDSVSVTGGTPAYSYSWTTGDTTASVSGLSAGIVSVIVVDQNGCSATGTDTLTEPAPMNADSIVVSVFPGGHNVSCSGSSDATATVYVSGGEGPYHFAWDPPLTDTTATVTGLSVGTYSGTATDANGCTLPFSVGITEPDPIHFDSLLSSYNGFNIKCNGDSSGIIDLTTLGGSPPYTYSWSNGDTTEDLLNAPAGNYTVTITDTNGCSQAFAFTLTEPTPLAVSDSLSLWIGGHNISCFGFGDGSIIATPSGGVPSYTFSWSNGITSDSLFSLAASTYTDTITDANGCVLIQSETLTEPTPLSVIDSISSYFGFGISCNGLSDGCIYLHASGATPGYSYTLSTETTDSVFCGLPAGTYEILVRDTNGCVNPPIDVTLTEPPAYVESLSSTPSSCGTNNGIVTANVSGGVPPYHYQWNTPGNDTTATVGGLGSGSYCVTVTDSVGCTFNDCITVGNIANLSATTDSTDNVCNGASNGSVTVIPSGGSTPYHIQWALPLSDTTLTVNNLPAGTYSVTVTDSGGCSFTTSTTVNEPPPLVFTAGNDTSICGNSLNMNATLVGGYNGVWTVISGSANFNTATDPLTPVDGLDIGPNVLEWTITNGTCTDSARITVTAFAPVNTNAGIDQNVCSDSAALSASQTVNYTGTWTVVSGTGTFSDPNDPHAYVHNMTPGDNIYQWMITNGVCSDSATVTITYSPSFANAGSSQGVCGDSTILSGNTISGFTGTWTTVSGSGTISDIHDPAAHVTVLGVGANVFQWMLTNGTCIDSSTVTITASTPVTADAGATQAPCLNSATLAATLPSGYAGTWSNVSGSGNFSDIHDQNAVVTAMTPGANVFQWSITDGICSANATVTINYTPAASTPGADQTICVTNTTMAATLASGYTGTWSVISGAGTFTSNTDPNAVVSNLNIGTNVFQWAITNGTCTDSANVTVTVSAAVTISAGSDQTTCNGNVTLAAGTLSGYSGTWSVVSGGGTFTDNTDPNTTVTGAPTGINVYQWSVSNGICSASATVTVTTVPANADAGTDQNVCGDAAIMGGSLASGYSGIWTVLIGTGDFEDATDPATQVSNLTVGHANQFIWAISNGTCVDADTVSITASDLVTASAGSDSAFCRDISTTYNLSASQPSLGSGFWSIVSGTGSIDNPSSPKAVLTPSEGLNVLIWTVNNGACANSDSVEITFKPAGECFTELELPTAFSPNGDQYNPAYVIHGIEGYPDNTFKVFNRWGNEVYSKDNYKNLSDNMADWVGQNNSGDPLPEGTYFVVLTIRNSNLNPPTRNTYVDLRR